MTYWNVVTVTKDTLDEIAQCGADMLSNMESNDDPGDAAEELADIDKRLTKLSAQIGPNVVALRKVAKALADVPGVRST
jgi:YbbR domain-containing protein